MAEKESAGDTKRTAPRRTVIEQNRDFFDQFYTRVVKTRFQVASDESAIRHMNIIVGSCTAARCQLMADGHTLVLLASLMASTNPEIQVSFAAPDGADRPPVRRTLRYQPPSGWIDPDNAQAVGDLTTWLNLTISSFLEWSAGALA